MQQPNFVENKSKEVLGEEFPSCKDVINNNFNCEIVRKARNQNDDICKTQRGDMTFCILSRSFFELFFNVIRGTFCPNQGKELQECMEGGYPGRNGAKIPPTCYLKWRQFDKCLTEKTREYEKKNKN